MATKKLMRDGAVLLEQMNPRGGAVRPAAEVSGGRGGVRGVRAEARAGFFSKV